MRLTCRQGKSRLRAGRIAWNPIARPGCRLNAIRGRPALAPPTTHVRGADSPHLHHHRKHRHAQVSHPDRRVRVRVATAARPRTVIDIGLRDRRRDRPRYPVSLGRSHSQAACQTRSDPTCLIAARPDGCLGHARRGGSSTAWIVTPIISGCLPRARIRRARFLGVETWPANV
jgi:hypothetical protein